MLLFYLLFCFLPLTLLLFRDKRQGGEGQDEMRCGGAGVQGKMRGLTKEVK